MPEDSKIEKIIFKEWKIIKFSYDTFVFENNGQNQAQTRIRVSSFKKEKENDFIIQYWYTLTKANSKKIILECIMQLYYQSTLPYSTEMIKPHIGQSYREFLKNMTKIESNLSSKGVSFPLPTEQEFINTVIS